MKIADREILLCSCGGTMPLDTAAIDRAATLAGFEGEGATVNYHLCGEQIAVVRRRVAEGNPCIVACTQEVGRFRQAADDVGAADLLDFVNIRETAGWSSEAVQAAPKILSLLAAASIDVREPDLLQLNCGRRVLVYGHDEATVTAAEQLRERADVTLVLVPRGSIVLPMTRHVPIHLGRARAVAGHIGAFQVTLGWGGEVEPWSRQGLRMRSAPTEETRTFDVILDISGGKAWFPDYRRRLGYFRANPERLGEIDHALFEITGLFGTLAKPRYVTHETTLCAHSSGGKIGCTRCIDNCPTGAIQSVSGAITIDAAVCAGCGSCSAVCPTEAMTYAAPSSSATRFRLATLLTTYLAAGGERPVLLIHSTSRGEDMINVLARAGEGLPANVLPLAIRQPTQIGLELLLTSIVLGAVKVVVQVDPEHMEETIALCGQIDLANRTLTSMGLSGERIVLETTGDPDVLAGSICDDGSIEAIAPIAELDVAARKDELIRRCVEYLHSLGGNEATSQPVTGAPFGSVVVSDACTICHACVRACPTGALGGDIQQLALSFEEARCVQCGLCAAVCPERAITLAPRFLFADEALIPQVIRSDEPSVCPQCGTRFGSKMAISRVTEKLEQSGWSEQNPELIDRLRMCETCRVTTQ